MINTFYDSYRILMRVYGQKTYIKQAINSETIEPINRSTVIKIVYGVVDNDIYLDYVLSCLCDKRPKLPVRVVLKIAIYNLHFLKKSPYAVTDSAVELLKKLGKGVGGFANAILRKYISSEIPLPTDYLSNLSVRYSYPEFAVKMLISYYGNDVTEKIVEYRTAHNYIRFCKEVDGAKYLSDHNKDFAGTPFNNLFDVTNFRRDEDYDKGIYTFQSIGSVAICDIVPEGEVLIDCCAAPGGKSVFLSEKFDKVIAFELHEHRTELIKQYALRMQVKNVETKTVDSTVFDSEYEQYADVVLCDCPCSGYGVVNENPDIKLNREKDSIAELHEEQVKILNNCSKYVKKGGYLIYSTCSLFNEENDETVLAFAPDEKGFEICDISSPLAGFKTEFGMQYLPHISLGAGFYVCKMRKVK